MSRFGLLLVLSGCGTPNPAVSGDPPKPQPAVQEAAVPIAKVQADEPCGAGPCDGGVAGIDGEQVGNPGLPLPPPPALPPGAHLIPPALLEPIRIAGTKQISPDDATRAQLRREDRSRVVGSWKFCVEPAGTVSTVTMLQSTRSPAYDRTIDTELRAWKFQPYVIDGAPALVCTAITFIYDVP